MGYWRDFEINGDKVGFREEFREYPSGLEIRTSLGNSDIFSIPLEAKESKHVPVDASWPGLSIEL